MTREDHMDAETRIDNLRTDLRSLTQKHDAAMQNAEDYEPVQELMETLLSKLQGASNRHRRAWENWKSDTEAERNDYWRDAP